MSQATNILAVCALASILVNPGLMSAREHPREWKDGRVVSFSKEHWVSSGRGHTTGQVNENGTFDASTSETKWGHNTYYLTLDDGFTLYFAERTLSWRWQHDPMFTENAPVKWALEKRTLILQTEDGKEFKMRLVKKRQK
jgi:hypothetical protein